MFWDDNDSEDSYVDVEELRRKLKDEYGTAAMINVDNMSDEEVIQEAEKLGIL